MKTNHLLLLFVALIFLGTSTTMITVPDSVLTKIANAIALAEGYFVANSRAKSNYNPGDLTLDLTGKSIGKDGMYVQYANEHDGFEALKRQIALMYSGSRIYKPSMTIMDVATRYAPPANAQDTQHINWATIVARSLGVTINTRLNEIT